jgi:hypothetical protein
LGGDLNFTIYAREIWGNVARSNMLASYLNKMIQGEGLIDVEPVNLFPTWRNGRGTQNYVAKRLDRFLISETLVDSGLNFRTWVVNVKLSDHMPVVFQLEPNQQKQKIPFKFNSMWLKDSDFSLLVCSNWHKMEEFDSTFPMVNLVSKLKSLKSLVIKWEKNKKLESKEEPVQLEVDMDILYSTFPRGIVGDDEREIVIDK